MRVNKGLDNIYFSHGIYIEHIDGIFNIPRKELTIINDRFMPYILKYLRTLYKEDLNTVTLNWYRKRR